MACQHQYSYIKCKRVLQHLYGYAIRFRYIFIVKNTRDGTQITVILLFVSTNLNKNPYDYTHFQVPISHDALKSRLRGTIAIQYIYIVLSLSVNKSSETFMSDFIGVISCWVTQNWQNNKCVCFPKATLPYLLLLLLFICIHLTCFLM